MMRFIIYASLALLMAGYSVLAQSDATWFHSDSIFCGQPQSANLISHRISTNSELDENGDALNFQEVRSLYNFMQTAYRVDVSGNYAYISDGTSGIRIIDISDPTNPFEANTWFTPRNPYELTIAGNFLYVVLGGASLLIADISDHLHPVLQCRLELPGQAYGVAVEGNIAYVGLHGYNSYSVENTRLRIYNVSDRTNPIEMGMVEMSGTVADISVSGNFAYMANASAGLYIVDISDPTNPSVTGSINTLGNATKVALTEEYAYVADYTDGIRVIDITDPANPVEVGGWDTIGNANSVFAFGHYAILTDWDENVQILDMADPTNPQDVGSFNTPGHASDVVVYDGYAYVADGDGGMRVADVSTPSNPSETGFFNAQGFMRGLAVSGDYAYLTDWYYGFRVVNISDSTNPVEVGYSSVPYDMRKVVVVGSYAYIAASSSGIAVMDVSNPSQPDLISLFQTGGHPLGIDVDGDYAYVADYNGGFKVIDISDPYNLSLAGSLGLPGSAWGIDVSGTYAYIADFFDGLRIIDISDPSNPVEIGSLEDPGIAMAVTVQGQYAYVANNLPGLNIIDISEPTSPRLVGSAETPGDAVSITVSGDIAYVAEQTNGIRAVDVSNPYDPVEVGYFDTSGSTDDVVVDGDLVVLADTYSLRLLLPTIPSSSENLTITLNQIDASAFPEIHSFVTVQDADGNPLSGLTSSNFILIEDGVGQSPLTVNAQGGNSNISTAVVMDYSGSMSAQAISDMQSACVDFVGQFNPGDRGAVVKFAEEVHTYQVYTASITDLTTAINSGYAYGTDFTALYDAVYEGISQTIPESNRSAIIALTDGEENHSTHTLDQTITYAQNISIPVFTIGLGSSVNTTVLQQLADETGGQYFYAPTSADLAAIYAFISETLNNQYEVIYTTSNDVADGTERAVHVEVTSGSDSGSDDGSYIAPTDVSGMALDIAEVTVASGDSVQIPVIVEEFSNVSVLELYIPYDESKLTFVGLTSEVMTGEVVNGAGGLIRLSWFSTTPLDLNDGDSLLTLRFSASGLGAGESTPLTWTDSECIVADYNGTPYTGVNYQDGSVTGLVNFSVSGNVSYFTGSMPVEGVNLDLAGSSTASTASDADGNYSFASVLLGNYTVTPSMDDTGHTGVNTLDAYRIQQDVEDLVPFTTGYELFASDVDGSGAVNTVDAYKIQRVVVGLDTDFAEGDWGFISSEYVIDLSNWTSAEQSLSYNPLSTTMIGQDFVGMRIGDANGTWPSAFLAAPAKLDELTGSLALSEEVVGPGEIATVELHAVELSEIGTAEWHIQFNHEVLTLQEIELPGLTGAMFTSTDSTINVSWFNVSTPTNCDDRILGRFQFQAPEEVGSESDLHLYNVVLGDDQGQEVWTEVGDGSVTVSDLTGVNYQGAELVTDWALRPAYPNPFNAYTTLSFDMKDAANVTIQVYNILGSHVTTLVDGSLPRGRYTAALNAQAWSSGTYFVAMKTSHFNKIQKIVLLK